MVQQNSRIFDWDEPPSNNGGKFMKLGPRNRLRLIGRPLTYMHAFRAGEEPKERYSIWVLDLDDGCKPKIMDFGKMLRRQFHDFQAATGIDPSGPDAPAFCVMVNGTGMDTKYSATPLKPTPIPAEIASRLTPMQSELRELRCKQKDDDQEAEDLGL